MSTTDDTLCPCGDYDDEIERKDARIDELEAEVEELRSDHGWEALTPEDIGMVPVAPLDNGKYTMWRFPDE